MTCGDVDIGGDIDEYITNFGKDFLYYNDGTGGFTEGQNQTEEIMQSNVDYWKGRQFNVAHVLDIKE